MATVTDIVGRDTRILDYDHGKYLVALELDRTPQMLWVQRSRIEFDKEGWYGRSALDRLISGLEHDDSECLRWTGSCTNGYGSLNVPIRGRNGHLVLETRLVHRITWEFHSGWAIPARLQLNHQCHSFSQCSLTRDCPHRRCAQFSHLELVTNSFHHTLTHPY